MTRFLFAILAAFFMALPANAQDASREARLAIAQDYVDATMEDLDMRAFLQQMWAPTIQQMQNSGQKLSPEQIAQVEQLYLDTLSQPMIEVMQQQAPIMADIMTLEELTALRDFYQSENGRAVMLKMPQLAQIQQPMMANTLRALTTQMLPELQRIMQGG